jgi:hypothetical protein
LALGVLLRVLAQIGSPFQLIAFVQFSPFAVRFKTAGSPNPIEAAETHGADAAVSAKYKVQVPSAFSPLKPVLIFPTVENTPYWLLAFESIGTEAGNAA